MKTCTKCHKNKPNTFHYYYKEASNEDGLRNDCKECSKARHKKWSNKKGATYKAWLHMNERCYNKNSKSYPNYGGRGIEVYTLWRNSYEDFLKYIGERPLEYYSVDRIDNNGNYEPGNIKWSTATEQNINTRKRKDNTSGYKGVTWEKKSNKWRATISANNKFYCLGRYDKKTDAINARINGQHKYWNTKTL